MNAPGTGPATTATTAGAGAALQPDDGAMYDRVGGEAALREMCERFHELILQDELLGEMFAYSGENHVDHLLAFMVEMFGGPARYSQEHGGIDGLYDAHLDLNISEPERARFVDLLLLAAEQTGLPRTDEFVSRFTRYINAGSHFSAKFSQPEVAQAPRPVFPAIDPWNFDGA